MIAGGLRPNAGLEPALLCLIMPGSLRADIIYSYAGNAFTTCNVPMLPVAILVPGHTRYQSHLKRTLSESALINLPFTNITEQRLSSRTRYKPDAKMEAQAETVAKKNGFASLAEYDVVSMNILMIMSGIDQQTKKFTEPPEQIRKEIAALKADKSVPDAEKKEDLAQLEAALKDAKPVQFKENIALVLKYLDKLPLLIQEHGPAD